MRLTSREIEALRNATLSVIIDTPFKLLLFGSRLYDQKKGGDIDLLVITDESSKSSLIELKNRIRLKIFEVLPEQRIDITVATELETQTDDFLKSVLEGAVVLVEQLPSKQ